MKLLILNWRDPYHPLAGGAEISLLEHAKYWQKKGADITWFASSFEGTKGDEKREGITYIRRGSHFTVHLYFLLSYILRLTPYNHDVIIDCFHFLPFFTPLYIKNKKIIALINEVAGKVWYANLPFPLAFIGTRLEPFFFKVYKNIPFITASKSAKDELLKVGIPERNITIIPHGITSVTLDPHVKKEKFPTLLFLGRVSKDKGITDVLKAYIEIRRKIKDVRLKNKDIRYKTEDVRLWIAGKEEQPGYLDKLLTSYNVSPTSVTYYGFVNEKKKFELLKRSWLLLHASVKEGWGLTVIEAGSQETPTIGYNVEGLRDSIRDGKTGLLVDPNPSSLAEAAIKVFSDKTLYNSMSKMSKKWSESFDWEKSGEKSWKFITK